MRVVECQSLAKVSRLSKDRWLLDIPASTIHGYYLQNIRLHYIYYSEQEEITKSCKCLLLIQTLGNKTYIRNERASIAQPQTKIKWSLFGWALWPNDINQTVPALKKKKEKNAKCIPKCWEFFGFWIWNFFENFMQQADSLKFG